MKDLSTLSDESLFRFYEDIRQQVMDDARLGGGYRFMGQAAKERADTLLTEIRRRGLNVPPISWLD
ncbi:MAG TPA: hypothetical protein VFA65_01375 [Bryobacteraceae bacterium]|nr:hypothetical protein [Bryobacteraceae bacterium]